MGMNLKTAILTSIIAFKSCDAATAIKQKAAVGIDLGTTNSCVAVVDSTGENSIRIIENSFTDKTTPSVVRVSLTDDNNLRYEVGRDAILKNKDDTIGNRFFSSCKRLLGYSSFDDDMLFEKINKNVSYHIKNGSDGDKSFIYMPIKDENNKEIYKLRPLPHQETIKKLYVLILHKDLSQSSLLTSRSEPWTLYCQKTCVWENHKLK